MEKFIAFNVYGRNSYGAAVTVCVPDGEEKEVYLAKDVNELLAKVRGEIVHNSGLRAEFQDFNDAIEAIDSVLMES